MESENRDFTSNEPHAARESRVVDSSYPLVTSAIFRRVLTFCLGPRTVYFRHARPLPVGNYRINVLLK